MTNIKQFGLITALSITLISIPATAETNFIRVKDTHMIALIHSHCGLGFDDDRAKEFAKTYAEAEGGVEPSEVERAIVEGDKLIANSIRLKQKEQLCALGKLRVGHFDKKWIDWVKGG